MMKMAGSVDEGFGYVWLPLVPYRVLLKSLVTHTNTRRTGVCDPVKEHMRT